MSFDPGYLAVFVATRLGTTFVGMPITGALTRTQANYVPKEKDDVAAEEKGQVQDGKSAEIGVLAMLGRTWKLEGARGIFKGLLPAALASIAGSLGSAALTHFGIATKGSVGASVGAAIALGILFIPFSVLTSRSIVSPLRLPFAKKSIRGVTSARERKEPLRLWDVPGMIANVTIQTLAPIAVTALTFPLLYAAAAAASPEMQDNDGPVTRYALAYIICNTLPTLWVVPLNVLQEKLSVAPDADATELMATDAEFERSATEDVVTPRRKPRYTGLIDAYNTVKKEEGVCALYRGWVWTALRLLVPAVSEVAAAINVSHAQTVVDLGTRTFN
ncbi:hypothetical protein CspeluHIS016_0803820 [Cutaneotrichosporon spelunceum]|uniref:Mitochondrial carrier n=1 Tax=Cutaneotrichosporon spelunceum TaxID=1672016 RepID=A0AAD3U063_9TREE|nr:hypothetical protein CspeluHIS016_0803820 [Cutaneotrichosporon spelunceum]